MDDLNPNFMIGESVNTTKTSSKEQSWSRSLRTSCDACKQMKIKCRRDEGANCARCIARKIDCITTPVERKRRKPKKDALKEMEDRIKRIESNLITSEFHGTAEAEAEPKRTEEEDERSSSDRIESQAELSNHLSNLVIDNGSPNFIGWASGFSLMSPQGLRWISGKVGDKDEIAQLLPKIMSKVDYDVWGRAGADLFTPKPRSQHSPLPSKTLAAQYVTSYFETFNNVFPLVNRKLFDSHFERQYSKNPSESIAWYALFNAILCLGSIRKKREGEKHVGTSYLIDYTSNTEETGVEYFRNASSCFHDLIFTEANLMAMQAMTLMMSITTSSPNPQPAFVLASATGNLSNTLGLHRRLDGFGLSSEETEQRRNVFWVFYLMEKAISHNLGRPSVINDDDIAVDLPPKNPGLIQSPSGIKLYDTFQDQITLAIIGSRICNDLYSASSQTRSDVDRMKVLGKLDNHLQRWRDAIPIDIRPEHPINCSDEQYVPVVMMHFIYLDAVIRLHRLSSHEGSFKEGEGTKVKSHGQQPRLNPRVYASQLLCLAAARRSIQLLDTLNSNNTQNQYLTWTAVYYPLSASLVLFTSILSNPQDQHTASDIQLMSLILAFITHSVRPGTSFAATPTLNAFKELHGIATRLVAKVPSQSRHAIKRGPESDDPTRPDSASSFPYDSTTTMYPDTDMPVSDSQPVTSGEAILDAEQDGQSTTGGQRSHESANDSPLNFAPFMPPEPSQFDFDFDQTIYDPLLSTTKFEWDMATMWDFVPDPRTWTNLTSSNQEPDMM